MSSATRKARSKSRSRSRSRSIPPHYRPLPVDFHPLHSYVMMGHGHNGIDTFIVPPDCMVITKAKRGGLILGDDFIQYINAMTQMRVNSLLHPLQHIPELIQNFGALRIYYPGDECPNFVYHLFPFNKTQLNDTKFYINEGQGGIIPVSLLKPIQYKINTLHPRFTREIIVELYEDSIYPNMHAIDLFIDRINPSATITDVLDALDASHITWIDQRTLCNMHRGIYYNFVCRMDIEHNNTYYNTKGLHTAIKQFNAFSNNPGVREIQLEHIANGLHRKQYLRNYYESNNFKRTLPTHTMANVADVVREIDIVLKEYKQALAHAKSDLTAIKIGVFAGANNENTINEMKQIEVEIKQIERDIATVKRERLDIIRTGRVNY